jgi:hypothetical protein
VRPTTWRLLVGVAAVAFALSWGLLTVGESRTGTIPDVPWPSAVVLAVFGGAVLVVALALRSRLAAVRRATAARRPAERDPDSRPPARRDLRDPVNPLVTARFAVLALACSRAGALFVGGYAGFLAISLSDLSIAYRRHLAFVSGACVLAALLLMVAGLVLERELRLPEPPQDGAADEDER